MNAAKFHSEERDKLDYPYIYPPFLPLNKSNFDSTKCEYLDLDITIGKSGAKYKLHDKRRSMGFEIVKYPHKDSCIHEKTWGGVIIGQAIRYAETCEHYRDFKVEARNLFEDFEKRGWDFDTFLKYYNNFATNKNPYPVESNKLVKDLVEWYKLSRR